MSDKYIVSNSDREKFWSGLCTNRLTFCGHLASASGDDQASTGVPPHVVSTRPNGRDTCCASSKAYIRHTAENHRALSSVKNNNNHNYNNNNNNNINNNNNNNKNKNNNNNNNNNDFPKKVTLNKKNYMTFIKLTNY